MSLPIALGLAILFSACPTSASSQALLTLGLRVLAAGGADHTATPQVGDRAIVEASTAHRPLLEFRLYRDKEVVLRCVRGTEAKGCRRDGDKVIGESLLAAGSYRAMAVASKEAPPAPTGVFDDDVVAAQRVGADVVTGQALEVR